MRVGSRSRVGLTVGVLIGLAGLTAASVGPVTKAGARPGARVEAAAATYYDAGNQQIDARHDGYARGTPLRAGLKQRWSREFTALNAKIRYTMVAGGRVFVMVDDDDDQAFDPHLDHGHRLWVLSLKSGKTLWNRWFPPGTSGDYASRFAVAAGSGRVYVVDGHGPVRAFSQVTGRRLWTRDLRRAGYGVLGDPTAVGGRLYFFDTKQSAAHPRTERVQVLDGRTGRTVWQRPLKGQTGSVISVAGKSVYMSGACQNDYRLDRETGAVVWHRIDPGCSGGGGNIPVLHSSGVWATDNVTGVVLSGATGRKLRTFRSSTAPAIAGDTAVLLDGDTLSAVATGTGAARWQKTIDGERVEPYVGPVISGRTVYFGGQDGYVIGYSLDTGAVVWNRVPYVGNHNFGVTTDLTIGDGALVVTANDDLAVFG